MRNSCRILGVTIDRVTLAQARARLDQFVGSGRPHQIVTVNADFVRLAGADPTFRDVLNGAALAVADGMPLVWTSRLMGCPLPERVAGVDLVHEAAALAARRGYGIYLLGAAPGVAEAAGAALVSRHPGLRIAGTFAPPIGHFSDRDEAEMVARVRAARPEMLFVAFGAPRQDLWIRRHLATLDVPVCMGVGGSFDLIANRVSRAPVLLRRAGGEWLHRLAQEPGRLWRRYLLGDVPVVLRMLGAGMVEGALRGTATES